MRPQPNNRRDPRRTLERFARKLPVNRPSVLSQGEPQLLRHDSYVDLSDLAFPVHGRVHLDEQLAVHIGNLDRFIDQPDLRSDRNRSKQSRDVLA